ncbi:MAG: tetratricopeptide repeat protein [Elusimicrobia bacterium]|nr:tetratricopeptide repeat protein [Elusimicrobiota bacterium]
MDAQYTCPGCGGTSDLKADRCPYCGSRFIPDLGPGAGSQAGAAAARKQAAVLEAKLAKSPNNGQALLELGQAYHQCGEYQKAQVALDKAASLLPQEPQVFLLSAWNIGIMKGWEKAGVADNAKRALTIDSNLSQAEALLHLNRGMTEYLFDRTILHAEMALKEFQAAVEADPKNTYGYFMTGCVCEELDEYQLAAQNFQKACELAEKDDAPGREDARVLARTGAVLSRLGETESAKKYLSRAVELDPDNEAARSILATIDEN